MVDFLTRSELLIGEDGIIKLKNAHVAICGIGGVGSYTAEALARCGVGKLTLIDHDVIDVTNINRQIHALHSTVGKRKVEVMAARLKDINPQIKLVLKAEFIAPENIEMLLDEKYDYLIDAVDNVTAKIALAVLSREKEISFLSSMGTANKLDNTKFRFCDISETKVDPLARVMRRELKKRGIERGITVLYSEAEALKVAKEENERKAVVGSMAFVPSVAGLMLAGRVVNELLR